MADNYLDKQYADYQARKSAMKPGASVSKARQAMWQVAEIVMPSVDDEAMRQFYVEAFRGEVAADGSVEFDNGMRLRFQSPTGSPIEFSIRMASVYQHEQLLKRLASKGITPEDGMIIDPSGNRLQIIHSSLLTSNF